VDDSEDCTDPVVGAEGTPPINALKTADILATGADLAEQALASRGLVRPGGSVWVGKCIDDVLWAQVGGGGRCRVVAVTGRRGPGLEVLDERLAILVDAWPMSRLPTGARESGLLSRDPSARLCSPGSWATAVMARG